MTKPAGSGQPATTSTATCWRRSAAGPGGQRAGVRAARPRWRLGQRRLPGRLAASSRADPRPARRLLLDPTAYATSTTYDALARPVTVTAPLDADGKRKILQSAYGRAGALTALTVDHDGYISQILYNARGQHVLSSSGAAR